MCKSSHIRTSAFYPHIRMHYPQHISAFYRFQHPQIRTSAFYPLPCINEVTGMGSSGPTTEQHYTVSSIQALRNPDISWHSSTCCNYLRHA